MKNFQVTDKDSGKSYWISRAIAICAIIIVREGSDSWILLQKRGPECPDFVGAWSHTCGYLDFDETVLEALYREVYEELGIDVSKSKITPYGMNDTASDKRQNVTMRYVVEIEKDLLKDLNLMSQDRGGENGEVSETMLLPVDSNLEDLEFAFNHKSLTKSVLKDPRFFAGDREKELFKKFRNAESGSGILGPTKIQWIVTRAFGRLHVTIEAFGIDTTWSCLPKETQGLILRQIAKRLALAKYGKMSQDESVPITDEVTISASEAVRTIEEDIAVPGTSIKLIDEFLL